MTKSQIKKMLKQLRKDLWALSEDEFLDEISSYILNLHKTIARLEKELSI